MNKIAKILLPLFATLGVFTISSCSKSDLILGEDNYILGFSLSADGTTYNGVFDGDNNIRIDLPFDIDLEQATVDYKISERARIIPDPHKVSNWNSEQAFKVISENGQSRTYVIRLIHEMPVMDGDVVLTNDDEVAEFAKKGINHIKGRLFIGGTAKGDSVKSIDALTSLQKVDYDIIISHRFIGSNLSGLRNIKEAGGLIIKSDVPNIIHMELKSLENVYGSISITNDVIKLVNMPKLAQINGDLILSIGGVEALELPALTQARSVSISGGKMTALKMRQLTTIKDELELTKLNSLGFLDISKLKSIKNGSLKISRFGSLFSFSLPQLESVGKDVLIQGNNSLGEVVLPELTRANNIDIQGNKHLSILNLEKLTSISGNLIISNAIIKSLNQVALHKIAGKLELNQLLELETIIPFINQLKEVGEFKFKEVDISENLDLSALNPKRIAFEELKKIGNLILPTKLESLTITSKYGEYWDDVPTFSGLREAGDVKFSNIGYTETKELFELPDLEVVTGSISISMHNTRVISLPKLRTTNTLSLGIVHFPFNEDKENGIMNEKLSCPLLETVAEQIDFNSPHLAEVELPRLKSIKKLQFSVYWPFNQNLVCTDLNKISSLESIEEINISSLKAFTDFSFLKKAVDNGSLKTVKTGGNAYNPTLTDLQEGKFKQP